MSSFIDENHRGSPTLTLLNVLGVLGVLNELNVLDMPVDTGLLGLVFYYVPPPL